MKNIIHPVHRAAAGFQRPYITDVEFDFVRDLRHLRLEFVTHIILLLLVPRKDANFANIRAQETVQHRIAKRPGPTGDK